MLILALLILGVNGLLSLRGEALPEEITTVAATVVADSLSSNDVPEAREAVVVEVAPTNLPIPTHSDMPWANADGDFDYYVLALSWQPAFCESQSRKPECASQTRDRYDATNFVLHGLWPNQADDPSHSFAYCAQPSALVSADKAGEWCELPDLALSTAVAHDLSLYMPGVASCFRSPRVVQARRLRRHGRRRLFRLEQCVGGAVRPNGVQSGRSRSYWPGSVAL
ncbi:MAG: hypothetical protein M5U34_42080 [Chloroflexi bacterium]|nr:hypothetical protein [Chloroflexota bacterium]